jgi:hypothetical protein
MRRRQKRKVTKKEDRLKGVDFLNSDLANRFWSKVKRNEASGCWEWQSYISPQGYGKFSVNNFPQSSHVIAFILKNGPIGYGLVIDHMCKNRRCVFPDHLRAVTQKINSTQNSNGLTAINAAKTHCHKGHEFSKENTAIRRGSRLCKACKRLYDKEWRLRKKG